MGRNIAIAASGINSPLSSAIAFAVKLRAAGYGVAFYAPQSAAAALHHAGFDHHVIPDPKLATFTPLLPRKTAHTSRAARRKAAIDALDVGPFEALLIQHNPDLVFIDCEMHAHIIVALAQGTQVVQYNNMFLSPPSLMAPPLHINAIPGQGTCGSKPGVGLIWAKYFFRKHSKIWRRHMRDKGADHPAALNGLARERGVPLGKLRRVQSWLYPWTYRIPTALFLPSALDLPTTPYDNMTYLGPMIWQDRPTPPQVDINRITRFCAPEPARKKIYVAFGSMMTPDETILPRIWDIAARHPEWHLLCVVGPHWTTRPENAPPSNVDVVAWAPQHNVLAHADLAIIHGGTGSVVEAVDAACPMLIYPHVLDQPGSAARVVFHGLGRAGRLEDSIARIETDITAILTDSSVKDRCLHMQRASRVENENNAALAYVQQML